MTFFMENSLEFRFADSFVFSEEFHQGRVKHLVRHFCVGQVIFHICADVYEIISDNLDFFPSVVHIVYPYENDAGIFDLDRSISGNDLISFHQKFPCVRIYDILNRSASGDPVGKSQLLVIFISAYLCKVISFRVKK